MAATDLVIAADTIRVLDHGFVRLDDCMASDLSVANAARVSFARRKEVLEESDVGLIQFLMRDRHGTPFEHNAFRFHVRCPLFVAREWFRHRVGCLTGDTVVTFVDGNSSPEDRRTIDELFRIWTAGEWDGPLPTRQQDPVVALASTGACGPAGAREPRRGGRPVGASLVGSSEVQRSRRRLTRLRVRVLDESSGEFTSGHVCDVIDKGVQPVYRVTLADGKALTLTENHRVLTSEGWATMRTALGLIGSGSEARLTRPAALIVNGIPAHRNRAWVAAQRRAGKSVTEIAAEAGCSYHTVRKWLRVHELRFSAEERLGRVPRNRGPREAGARLVPAPSRRAPLCRGGVGTEQGSEPAAAREFSSSGAAGAPAATRPGFTLTADAVRVVAVAFVGLRQTYDLSIAGPWHNFVANGVVVHNSFNEFSMRYAKATDEFYVPEPEDVRSQVGKPGAYTFEPVDAQLAEETREELRAVYQHAFETYERLVEQGVARELARVVIPVGAYTEFYWTLNARSLMNFVSLRAAETAQREIRRYAEACERFLAEKMPVTHAAFVANDRTAP